ncbi:MAG: Gfo/Idh/MocA family oxidoreductase [Holosporaceae bacterium]|nr:Gfo/Idh/MocA family oxidoreductase [Holosporaceae bacterium]
MVNKYLVTGLGSMGKRRVRCLLSLGIEKGNIGGFDLREDRRIEASEKYGISVFKNIDDVNFSEVKAVIVSLPPDKHSIGAKIAIDHGKPVFIEASVVLEDVLKIRDYNKDRDVFIAPSCTMMYHHAVKDIFDIINSKKYGRVCNFSYHSGQYLPDWHPWEDVKDYYVGNRITGGAREIVPFELTWITSFFGFPRETKGYFRKTIELGCEIEDTYAFTLDYKDMVGSMVVDVAARYAVRNLIINLEKAQIQWRWDNREIELYEAESGRRIFFKQPMSVSAKGYNENIGERMYVDEIRAFFDGINDRSLYPNTIEKDIGVLKILGEIENSDGGFNR